MKNNAPDIKPIKIRQFEVKQSKYNHVGELPARAILVGPSGSGKTALLQNLIMDVYRDWSRLAGQSAHHIFSKLHDCQNIALTDQIKINQDFN